MNDSIFPSSERTYLRELARRYAGYAALPVMVERARLWQAHNELRGPRPMVVMEIETFAGDMLPPLRCQSKAGQALEKQLQAAIVNHEQVDDDKVIPPYVTVPWQIQYRPFDADFRRRYSTDSRGVALGYVVEPVITDLERDLPNLRHSVYSADREATFARRDAVAEAVGDLLPVRIVNESLLWYATPSASAVMLMSDEQLFVAMATQPEAVRALVMFIVEDMLAFMDWLEREELLTLNNGNQYAGAGSYGFTSELPRSESAKRGGKVLLTDLWMNMNSQETVAVSPSMYRDLVFPAYEALAAKAGLVYYGCCEPVHAIWDDCVSRLANLRKVSVSAWCDEERIGEGLRAGTVIYSRKPSPNLIGVDRVFREEAFGAHIERTLRAARGGKLEIIFRDIYSLCGEAGRPFRAVKIVRDRIDRLWGR